MTTKFIFTSGDFGGISVEPLLIGVASIDIGIERTTTIIIYEVAVVASMMVGSTSSVANMTFLAKNKI